MEDYEPLLLAFLINSQVYDINQGVQSCHFHPPLSLSSVIILGLLFVLELFPL
uniref:Uncharacterized protein n=1 Tax=Rhizophora mucronata TaxID=61149 RepID=A0A2P2QV40_RHIMU